MLSGDYTRQMRVSLQAKLVICVNERRQNRRIIGWTLSLYGNICVIRRPVCEREEGGMPSKRFGFLGFLGIIRRRLIEQDRLLSQKETGMPIERRGIATLVLWQRR